MSVTTQLTIAIVLVLFIGVLSYDGEIEASSAAVFGPQYPFTQQQERRINWVEDPSNWPKCIDYTKEFVKNLTYAPIPYPKGDPSNVNACIVLLVGSGQGYRDDFKRGIIQLDKNFNQMHHFPMIAFHFNMNEQEQQQVRNSINSPIEFVLISRPSATDPVSELNPTPIGDWNSAAYSFPLEYRYQSYFFFDTLFNHPKVQNYTYIMRIDNDIDILVPINYNPFLFMEMQGKVFGIRHWSMDPHEICGGIYEPTYLYMKEFYNWIDSARDRPIPPKCYCGGGATFFAYAPFFRSPQIQAYWKFIQCLGGIWTNRWAEQNLFPIAVSLVADNPEKRYHVFTNVAVHHKTDLLQPHVLWGVPNWPYHPQANDEKTITAYLKPSHHKRGCIVYLANKMDVSSLRRSLFNLENHFLRMYPYPVFVFYQNLSEGDIKSIRSAVSDQFTELQFVSLDNSISRRNFNMKAMFEQDVLKDYGYFLRLHPGTNVVADWHWDPFKIMDLYRFQFGYHRWHSPMASLEPEPNDALWELAVSIGKHMGSPYMDRPLPPKNFYYSLEYFAMGNLDFFRSKEYLAFASEMPDSASVSHAWPIALSILEPEPWRKIFDMTNVNINWGTSDPTPFAAPSWWEQTPIPTWPFKYSNRNPPCPP